MIRDNVLRVKERIALSCSKINRNPDEITIVAVSKGRGPEQIREAVEAGITDIGENRVQEAVLKYNAIGSIISDKRINWHLAGHLQTNKAKAALNLFDLIQSVDSIHLAEEINKQADRINKIQDILVEIKTSPEETKFGVRYDEAIEVITGISGFKNIRIKGLMTVAPLADNPQNLRPYFKMLKELKDKINQLTNYHLTILSMGMTDDFEIAIEEGANMVRLGRAIFEG
jgi:pyridoxal phosphate enzyme (YggS family)